MKGKEIDVILSVVLLAILVLVTFLQVVFRFVLNLPLAWSEELSRFTYIFMVGLATSIAIKTRSMIKIEFLELFVKNPKTLNIIEKSVDLLAMLFTLFVAFFSIYPLMNAFSVGQVSPALRWPVGFLYATQMLLYLIMAVRYFMQLFHLQK
ncbi:MAG: TRAP transporter small permease [Spirochaetota bacterium]